MSPPVLALLPFVFLALTAVALLLAAAFYRSHRLSLAIALIGLALTLGDTLALAPGTAAAVTPLILVDGHARLYIVLLVLATLAVLLLSYYYLGERRGQRQEFYILLVMAALGGAVLVAASHFASFFLGLELLSVSLYALIAYPRARSPEALEAGMKYLILAGAASAFILFGMALIYADLGTMATSGRPTSTRAHPSRWRRSWRPHPRAPFSP
jgi:NADH-quinone oxidoreductase subunit N